MKTQIRIIFEPQGRSVAVPRGTTVLQAAARVGLMIETPCGGSGTCGKCRVRLTQGCGAATAADKHTFTTAELHDGWRLACRTTLDAPAVITIPPTSLVGDEHQIMAASESDPSQEVLPDIRKHYVELSPPTLSDDVPDLLRLEQVIGPFKADLALIRNASSTLREHDFKGTAVLSDHRLIGFEVGDTREHCFGVAFDVGTTTLVGELFNLCDGTKLGVVSRVNPQVSFGDDVLSRIRHATVTAGGLEEMRVALAGELTTMIAALCKSAGVKCGHIYAAAFAGNTTMEHVFCGLNPAQLGQTPFVPMHARGLLVPASELGLSIHYGAHAYIFPVIGGFVGGDTVAGMLATRLDRYEGTTLLVDIGTNGEIVLAHEGAFFAASTAAGPAFEGARIACGMRGTRGAIEKVALGDDVQLEVIGNATPTGICGSGLIDIMAQLLEHGIVTSDGQMLPPEELPPTLAPALAQRVRVDTEGATYFLLAEAYDRSAAPVILTQRDVREVQLGSGAVRTGVTLLLRQAGLTVADIDTVLLAGGFGNYLRRSSAQRIGLLPGGISHDCIRYIGNASLAGTKAALLSEHARRLGEDLARRVRHVELSTMAGFQDAFVDAMFFPESS